jgi:Holliday junction resolvase RusA-like endonuclease
MNNPGLWVIPMPPPINQTYKISRRFMYKSKEARAFECEVVSLLSGVVPTDKEVRLRLDMYFKTNASDIDGRIKITLDSMQGFLYDNDRQIIELNVTKRIDKIRPRVEVFLLP